MAPYNSKNHLIDMGELCGILSAYGVHEAPRNLDIYRNAFVNKSYCTRKNENFIAGNVNCPPNCIPLQESSNERMEFLGDAVLGLTVGKYLYRRYPDADEGFLTHMRSKLVCGKMCGHLSGTIHLDRYILLSLQIEDIDGRRNQALLEDVFEAFIAAVFLDFDSFSVAERFIVSVLETHVDFSELVIQNNNHKDMYLKYVHQHMNFTPRFLEMKVEPQLKKDRFTVCIKNDEGEVQGIGKGNSKKDAENHAAQVALERLKQSP